MFKRKIFNLILLTLSIALAGCGNSSNKAAITGVITHSHRMSIPSGYKITVQIEDTTKVDTPGKKIAETVIESQGVELPMPFEVIYDPGKINPSHTYSLQVKIEDSSGTKVYSNNTIVPVITNGNPTHKIEVILVLSDG